MKRKYYKNWNFPYYDPRVQTFEYRDQSTPSQVSSEGLSLKSSNFAVESIESALNRPTEEPLQEKDEELDET